tara:strand:- start:24907 stop:25119 length:213 start_codon:yes stop_codon:yes gene_type:complete
MSIEQSLAFEVKQRFCYIELEKWKHYLCNKRTIEEVEAAIAATTSIIVEIQNLENKIYNENIPEYDDPLI